jgi:hypothetical protein
MDLPSFYVLIMSMLLGDQMISTLDTDDYSMKTVRRFETYQECQSHLITMANGIVGLEQVTIDKIKNGRIAATVTTDGLGTYGFTCAEIDG